MAGGKTYSLNHETVKVLNADDQGKVSFSEQSYVAKSTVEGYAAQLATQELKDQYDVALADTDASTYYTQTISGTDLSFSWKSLDGSKTYTLASERIKVQTGEQDGKPVYGYQPVKWNFSSQFRVQKVEIEAQAKSFDKQAVTDKYLNALDLAANDTTDDVNDATVFTKIESGTEVSYSWKSISETRTYSLSRAKEKVYIPETETVNGVSRIKTDADGNVIYKTRTRVVDGEDVTDLDFTEETKWNFSEQVLVLRSEVEQYSTLALSMPNGISAEAAELETQQLKDQLAAALRATSATSFTRTISGSSISFSWKAEEGGKTYSLSGDLAKVLKADGTGYAGKVKWSFAEQVYVLKDQVDDYVSKLPADQQSRYTAALADTDDSTYFTRAVSGDTVSYSWKSLDGIKTYSLVNERVKDVAAEGGYKPAKWSFSEQYRVVKAEVEGHVLGLEEDQQEQYTNALRDVNDATVYTKTLSGTDASYGWQNPLETVTYNLSRSLQRFSDAEGELVAVVPPDYKWAFSSQTLVEKAVVKGSGASIENDAMRSQYIGAGRTTRRLDRIYPHDER